MITATMTTILPPLRTVVAAAMVRIHRTIVEAAQAADGVEAKLREMCIRVKAAAAVEVRIIVEVKVISRGANLLLVIVARLAAPVARSPFPTIRTLAALTLTEVVVLAMRATKRLPI